jgi:hypothetical protein
MLRRAFALAVLLGIFFAHGTAAQGAFAPANDEIAEAEGFSATGIATDAQGNSIVVWSQRPTPESDFEAKARRLDVGGGLGPIIDLAPGEYGYRPAVGMTASGRAFAAWRREVEDGDPQGVRGRWIEPDGSLGPLLTLATGGPEVDAGEVLVVVDPAGTATVAWKNQDGSELEMRRVEPNGTLSATVPDVSKGAATNPEIAALPGGETVAVWRGTGVEMNIVSKTLIAGEPNQISEANSAGDPQIAVDSLGNGLVIWRTHETLPEPDEYSVRGRRVGATGALGVELTIDPPASTEVGSQVEVSADTQNDFVVTWSREDAEEDAIVYARRGNNLGVPTGPAQPISADGTDGQSFQAALEDGGTGAVVWANSLGSGNFTTLGRTIDSVATPTGGIQEFLAEGGSTEVSGAPPIGFAAFLVEYPISGSARAAVVRRFMLPPTCSDSTATVVQGQPIEAPLACSGLAIEGAQVVELPLHGETGAFNANGPTVGYTPTPGFEGTDSFTYAAVNDGGASNVARVEIAVGRDTVKPRITSFRFVQSVPKPGARSSAKKPKPKKRIYKFLLKFSELSTTRVVVERPIRGIRRGKRCVKARRGAKGKRCTRWQRIGTVSSGSPLSTVTLRAKGKLAKRLRKGGRFRARGTATDRAGNSSSQRTLKFQIRKKKRRG